MATTNPHRDLVPAPPPKVEMTDIHTGQQHNFTLPNLDPYGPLFSLNIQPTLRLLCFFKRRPDVSEAKFHTWWSSAHADLTVSSAPVAFTRHVLRYAQLHKTSAHDAMAPSGWTILPFDACGEITVKTWDDFLAFQTNPDFLKKLIPDGDNFIQRPIQIFPNYEHLVYGPAMSAFGGADGLKREDVPGAE